MKKFSKLISMILAFAMILCATSVVAFAEEPTFEIDAGYLSGYVGETLSIWASMSDWSDLEEAVTWTITDESIIDVVYYGDYSQVCNFTLLSAGSTIITATYKGESRSCEVVVNALDVLTLNTATAIVDDGNGFTMQFTAPAADYYAFYFTETDCEVYGGVNSMNGYASFGIDADGKTSYGTIYIEENETVIVNGGAYITDPNFTSANYSLKAEVAPEATGYVMDQSSVTLGFLNESICDYAMVYLLANPAAAPVPTDVSWEVEDDSIIYVDFYGGECFLAPLKVGTTTLKVFNAAGTLLASIPVEVKDSSTDIIDMEWGVLYDFDSKNTLFSFTADKADTYTLESILEEGSEADPYVDAYKKNADGEWEQFDRYDDQYDIEYNVNFKGIFDAAEGDEYLFVLDNWTDDTTYTFSIKGTDASDPGYDVEKVAANPATCTADGNIEYYLCKVTGLKFTDATAKRLAGDVVIKAEGHKLEKVEATDKTIAHEKCSVCGALFVDGKEVTSVEIPAVETPAVDNPKTGDNAMLLPMIALSVLSITGLAVAVVGKKNAI